MKVIHNTPNTPLMEYIVRFAKGFRYDCYFVDLEEICDRVYRGKRNKRISVIDYQLLFVEFKQFLN